MSGNCPLPRQCMVARTTVLPRGRWLSGASGSRSESSSLWLPAPGCHQPGDQRTGCACHSVSRWLGRGRVPRGARLSSSPVGAKRLCPGPDALRFCPSSCPALQPPPPTQCASLSRPRRSTLGSGGVRRLAHCDGHRTGLIALHRCVEVIHSDASPSFTRSRPFGPCPRVLVSSYPRTGKLVLATVYKNSVSPYSRARRKKKQKRSTKVTSGSRRFGT